MSRRRPAHWSAAGLGLLVALTLAGCGAPGPLMPEQRPQSRSAPPPSPAPSVYRVREGDTLYSIAFRFGLDWREMARWNRIGPPYTIRVGQSLDLRRPAAMEPAIRPARPAVARTPSGSTRAEAQPSTRTSAPASASNETPARSGTETSTEATADPVGESRSGGESTAAAPPEPRSRRPSSASAPSTSATSGSAPVPTTATRRAGGVDWRWPTAGSVARGFNPGDTRKGILISGTPGQPVRAAADGTVVYSGNGLIGYGELIIVKHNDRMLSAYAHNRTRQVAEGDPVRGGQVIATLGRNERDDPVLHFEIRRDGQPVDPTGFLPQR
ncbi:peptidoglycan DD-metalloendopeptidase family protein [Halomonas denitrificans]|nr:peptidoglycan DD-metalloendopeptidase family protein [Halomonas denitrificans]